ncbi:hypothetical protein JCM9279_002843 [Rhodotorula babjevae]
MSTSLEGQRGRPRKSRVPRGLPPPSRLKTLRSSPWFAPALGVFALVILLLLYSAVRISAHSSDYSPPITVRSASPGASSRRSTPSSPSSPSSSSSPGAHDPPAAPKAAAEEQVRLAMDDAVRHALEEAWNLPQHEVGAAAGGSEGSPPRQRTLAELYAELEELGVSPHELQEVLDDAYRDSGERH